MGNEEDEETATNLHEDGIEPDEISEHRIDCTGKSKGKAKTTTQTDISRWDRSIFEAPS